MKSIHSRPLLIASLIALSAPAQAELQTWQLTATVYQVDSGFTPPPFAAMGQTFQVDFVIDTLVPASDPHFFNGAVTSFSINGITSEAGGYLLNGAGLNAINAAPTSLRADGIDFLSFNNFGGISAPDVTTALQRFAEVVHASSSFAQIRVDFGEQSVFADPSSFVVTSVPEPASGALMLLGLPLLLLRKQRMRNA